MNNIELSGWVYNKKIVGEKLTTFTIKFYAGKDKNGTAQNGFANCKYFGVLPQNEKDKIEIKGWLGYDTWEKDGKKTGRMVVLCKEAVGADLTPTQNTTAQQPVLDDDIPF